MFLFTCTLYVLQDHQITGIQEGPLGVEPSRGLFPKNIYFRREIKDSSLASWFFCSDIWMGVYFLLDLLIILYPPAHEWTTHTQGGECSDWHYHSFLVYKSIELQKGCCKSHLPWRIRFCSSFSFLFSLSFWAKRISKIVWLQFVQKVMDLFFL